MSWEFVLYGKEDHMGTITINNPDKFNAFTRNTREEILEALELACSDEDVRVIVITGVGKAFCSGGDVNEIVDGSTKASSSLFDKRPTMAKIPLLINSIEKPVIAAVNGVAAGGGCNLALSCDIRIASDNARFFQTFAKSGAFPDWGGIHLLPKLVGYAKAAELFFTGDIIGAEEALRIGLVNKVVPHDELASATKKIAGRIAKNAPVSIALIKRGLQNFYKMDITQAVDFESYCLRICFDTEDSKEGFRSFLEKRAPNFTGR